VEKVARRLSPTELMHGLKRYDVISGKNKKNKELPIYSEATLYRVISPWNGGCIRLSVEKTFHLEKFNAPVTLYWDEVNYYDWYIWEDKEVSNE